MNIEKKNLLLSEITENMQYKSKAAPRKKNYPARSNVQSHGRDIRSKYEHIYDQKQVAAIKMKGTYAEFSGMQGFELATKSLENRKSGIRLLNVQIVDGIVKATVFIPEGKEDFFRKRIEQYSTEVTKKNNPKHQDLVGSIENIKLALLESFWTDKQDKLPDTNRIKCEIWLRYEITKNNDEPWCVAEDSFHNICDELGIQVDKTKRILFPERIVKVITANQAELKNLLETCEYITEIKCAESPTVFFTEQDPWEQNEWINDLLQRSSFANTGISICLLDAGINSDHALLKPAILEDGVHTVDSRWNTNDSPLYKGHGTEMAGIALYDDLQSLLESNDNIEVNHSIESVKILPNHGQNSPDLYGAITEQAAYIAEIDHPELKRVLCMAVTTSEQPFHDGRPTSWSASIDELVSAANEDTNRCRLFIVSAGNIEPNYYESHDYPDQLEPVQNPGQAWNAVTVGAYADRIAISQDTYKGYSALAPRDAISPYSTTSVTWDKKWPVKPEVLFKGGNIATNGSDYSSCDDLSFLTTGHRQYSPFSTICATSAATAQAAYFAATIQSVYPDLWPETIRALMVHSAEWTDEMFKQFCPEGRNAPKGKLRNLLRSCGYGIPNLDRAIQCVNNSVNMIVQSELQPFKKGSNGVSMNEMHFHSFPWPKDLLRDLGETEIKLRITLSYYIEPSPGEVGWKDKYRYPSCGLRFDLIRTNESIDEFKYRVNQKAHGEDDEPEENIAAGYKWVLGTQNRDVGSIHSDFLITTAANLCESECIAVYPVGGWWKERSYLGKSDKHVKYSLVVSLSTPEESIDLYTPIITQIAQKITISTPVA